MCFARVNKCVLMMFDRCVLVVYDFRVLVRGPPNFQFSDKHIEYMGKNAESAMQPWHLSEPRASVKK